MTDDGCTDDTSIAVRTLYPQVNIIQTPGNLYWSKGMHAAWEAANSVGINYDYYLWFNDDVDLYEDSLTVLLRATHDPKTIITGAFCDDNNLPSYGARGKDYQLLEPNSSTPICYLNGNLVLIPAYVYQQIGMIDAHYSHGFGDYDYGFKALRSGCKILLTSVYVGHCNRHDKDQTPYWNSEKPFSQRWKLLFVPKYDINSEFYFLRQYKGWLHAIYIYSKRILLTLIPSLAPSSVKHD